MLEYSCAISSVGCRVLQLENGVHDEFFRLLCIGHPLSHAAFVPGAKAPTTLLSSAPQGLCTPVGCALCPVQIVNPRPQGHIGEGAAFSLVQEMLF